MYEYEFKEIIDKIKNLIYFCLEYDENIRVNYFEYKTNLKKEDLGAIFSLFYGNNQKDGIYDELDSELSFFIDELFEWIEDEEFNEIEFNNNFFY